MNRKEVTAYGYIAFYTSIMVAAILFVARHFKSEIVSSKMIEVEMVAVSNPPKNFYVDLKDMSTGIQYDHVFVSKWFSDYNQIPLNFPVVVTRVERRYVNQGNKIVTEFEELKSGLEWAKQYNITH